MLNNYLKIAFRHLKKQKLHSFINIAGLTLGMAVSILILSYVWFEYSFDRFQSKADQIYRVVQSRYSGDKESHQASTGNLLAPALKEEFPEIIEVARFRHKTDIDLQYTSEHKIALAYYILVTAFIEADKKDRALRYYHELDACSGSDTFVQLVQREFD